MDGFGIYTWSDGRTYQGFYKEDKKHGFGIYKWSDSKSYSGWWYEGKQHGLGIYDFKKAGGGSGKLKFGIWEDGKKVRWFNKDEIDAI